MSDLGHLEERKLVEEVHRFKEPNGKRRRALLEFDRLFQEIKNGLKKCKEIGKIPVTYGCLYRALTLYDG